jgi:hypothetical protein
LRQRRFVEDAEHADQRVPRLGIVLRFDLVQVAVVVDVRAEVFHPRPPAWAARNLPARAAGHAVDLASEIGIELLRVDVHTPVLAIDDDPHEVGLGNRRIVPRDLGVQHRPHEARITIAVEQVQRPITKQPLVIVNEVEREVERLLRARADHPVGRRAAEVHADVRIGLAVDYHRRRKVDIRVVGVGQLRFPVVTWERQEDRAQRRGVVERRIAEGLNTGRREGAAARLREGALLNHQSAYGGDEEQGSHADILPAFAAVPPDVVTVPASFLNCLFGCLLIAQLESRP